MVTVVAPFLNEINFAKAWAENVSKYADQVVVCDTGSTDGTWLVLKSYGFKGLLWRVDNPYQWEEAVIRNYLLSHAEGNWIVPQDLDELVDDKFIEYIKNPNDKIFHRFPIYWFCYGWQTRKVRTGWKRLREGREHYSIRLIKNNRGVEYRGNNHCYLTYRGLPKGSARLSLATVDIPIFHYHLLFPPKRGDNSIKSYYVNGEALVSYLRHHPKEIRYLEKNTV